jgi:hypothetical protein
MSWTQRYESLRRYVLQATPRFESPPVALAVWLAKGMAGWMCQCKRLTDPGPPWPRVIEPGWRSAGWQQQLTSLLAQMTLTQLQVHTRP